jgi:hypothetical protein
VENQNPCRCPKNAERWSLSAVALSSHHSLRVSTYKTFGSTGALASMASLGAIVSRKVLLVVVSGPRYQPLIPHGEPNDSPRLRAALGVAANQCLAGFSIDGAYSSAGRSRRAAFGQVSRWIVAKVNSPS